MELDTNRLQRLRLQMGWSRAETARQVGLNLSFYSQLERKVRRPSEATVLRLAETFGVDVEELVA